VTSRRAQRRNLRFVRQLGPDDVYASGPERGGILQVVPGLRDDHPAEVKNALDRRRRADLTGRCDCGARMGQLCRTPDGMLHATFEHENDCPASNDLLRELFRRYGIKP
jgi:hypothetical protein